MIDGKTATFGLLGNPVEHTLSPAIHNALAERLGINMVYLPFPVERGSLEAAVRGAFALHIQGLNVTVPYKSEVIPYLAETDLLARRIGAVNTLVRAEGGYKGYNTDMPGLYRAMASDGVKIEGARAVVLGAGGAARAVAALLEEKGAEEIVILNRTPARAEEIAAEVNAFAGKKLASALPLAEAGSLPGREYLAIQTTNVGLHPRDEDVLIGDEAFYRRVGVGYDLIFNPARTGFMRLVEKHGGTAYNGLKMLLYQGIIAFELWNGVEITEETAQAVYGILLEESARTGSKVERNSF